MNKNTTRATAVVGTTMALVIAGTAAVAAAGPRDRDDMRGFGGGKAGIAGRASMGGMHGGMRMGGGLRGLDADFQRTEHSVQTADGTTVARVEQGAVDSASADSLSFSLGSGEAVTVVIDDDTQVVAFEEQEVTTRRGLNRTRMAPTEVEPAEIAGGTEVVVWSDAEDGEDFVASRVVIRPADTDDADVATDEAEADEATEATDEAVEDAAVTDA